MDLPLSTLPKPTELAIPGFILLILVELIYARSNRRVLYETRDTFASLIMGLGSTVAGALTGGMVLYLDGLLWQHVRLTDLGTSLWVFVAAFILYDLAYYWFHRLAHRVRWFWASHVIHHSSQHYNLSTALRQTWTGFFSLSFIFAMPMVILGFHPLIIVFVGGLNLVYQFWIHTETIDRLPRWFEAIFNTPSHHRVHHATNPRYLDSNFAGTLIIWDRLFGTFIPERDDDPCRYGIVKNLATFNPLRIAFHEWLTIIKDVRRSASWREKIGYFLGPPGWSPDGSRQTSQQIRQAWLDRLALRSQVSDQG